MGCAAKNVCDVKLPQGRCQFTFSSSFRFSLKFFRRRAISARRMARSSAVKCFLTWGSIPLVSVLFNLAADS